MALEDELRGHVAALEHIIERTPDYEGDDPRAEHYRRQREACRAAISALTERKAPEGTEQHLCGHCGAQYLLMGADYLDTLSKALDDAGAPKWSADRSVMFSLTGRIEALAAERKAPVEVEGLVAEAKRYQEHILTPDHYHGASALVGQLADALQSQATELATLADFGERASSELSKLYAERGQLATELATLKQQLAEREEALREARKALTTIAQNDEFPLDADGRPMPIRPQWSAHQCSSIARQALTRTDGGDQ